MKNLLLCFIALVTITFASCGPCSANEGSDRMIIAECDGFDLAIVIAEFDDINVANELESPARVVNDVGSLAIELNSYISPTVSNADLGYTPYLGVKPPGNETEIRYKQYLINFFVTLLEYLDHTETHTYANKPELVQLE